jgi:hypothetical protein
MVASIPNPIIAIHVEVVTLLPAAILFKILPSPNTVSARPIEAKNGYFDFSGT